MKFKFIVSYINKLLILRNITISELSQRTNISLTGIKKMLESGAFKLENLDKIAEVLGVPVYDLIRPGLGFDIEKRGKDEILIVMEVPPPLGESDDDTFNDGQSYIDYISNEKSVLNRQIDDLKLSLKTMIDKNHFLNEQLDFYKKQAEAYAILNEKLLQAVKKSGAERTDLNDYSNL